MLVLVCLVLSTGESGAVISSIVAANRISKSSTSSVVLDGGFDAIGTAFSTCVSVAASVVVARSRSEVLRSKTPPPRPGLWRRDEPEGMMDERWCWCLDILRYEFDMVRWYIFRKKRLLLGRIVRKSMYVGFILSLFLDDLKFIGELVIKS